MAGNGVTRRLPMSSAHSLKRSRNWRRRAALQPAIDATATITNGWWKECSGSDCEHCSWPIFNHLSLLRFCIPMKIGLSSALYYDKMKSRRFVLYPGKVSNAECFRIGTIGHVFPDDMTAVVANTGEVLKEMAEIGDVRIDVE